MENRVPDPQAATAVLPPPSLATSTAGDVQAPIAASPIRPRIDAIDLLRGIVMVLMVLDHARDFVHSDAIRFNPTDLAQTSTLLFLTRWVTHFCAPIFVFLAGTAAYLQAAKGKSKRDLSRFLLTRGLWLVLLEFTLVRIGTWLNVDYSFLGMMQVIWAIGVSMIVLAGLVHFRLWIVAAFGVGMIALHNLFDGIQVQGWAGPGSPAPGFWDGLWIVLHQPVQVLPLFGFPGPVVFVLYPLIPWIGVMAAGYVFGVLYTLEAERRRKLLLALGGSLLFAFFVLRLLNVYGDPQPWQVQESVGFTALSFLNVTKYPVSLLFLLMTLGTAIIALALFEGRSRGFAGNALITFGRVPLFFYLLQWPLVHGAAILLSYAAGKPADHLFETILEWGPDIPADAGFDLWVVYLCWIFGIAILYPICQWFAGVKQRRRDWWLSYL